jgi:hypothetical protein
MNARSGCLLDGMKDCRTDTENSLKEFRQDFSQFREELTQSKQLGRIRLGRNLQGEGLSD